MAVFRRSPATQWSGGESQLHSHLCALHGASKVLGGVASSVGLDVVQGRGKEEDDYDMLAVNTGREEIKNSPHTTCVPATHFEGTPLTACLPGAFLQLGRSASKPLIGHSAQHVGIFVGGQASDPRF